MLKGKQKKLDKNKDGKISGEDFKMMKAKDGKSVKTFEELQKFGVTTKKSPKENGFKEALDRELRRAEATQKLQRKPALNDKQRSELRKAEAKQKLEKFAGKNTMKDLGQLKGALSEKELDFIKGLNKSKGGTIKKLSTVK